ncbi:hypothetical protein Adt_18680 [Abeliophyllum distichum]|uniref:Uncharacterized protein n=1 Tax=Abeliophyllum distichum TaxID=126358 RepID=A0ABD1TKW8_9LAMI
MDVPVALQLDDDLTSLASATSMVQSKIKKMDLEVLRLAYDISAMISLCAPHSHERVDDPSEGYIAIYESTMQHGLHLLFHNFFHEVLRDFNLASYQIMHNG